MYMYIYNRFYPFSSKGYLPLNSQVNSMEHSLCQKALFTFLDFQMAHSRVKLAALDQSKYET